MSGLKPSSALALLIKPQFEAGPGRVDRGIVRDEAVRKEVCHDLSAFVALLGFTILGLIPSPITGADGNQEYLLGARRG
jgi:23S rRNA (cytidine1920-2'-O)/16S rRNA (cytidine1409-2'-O)-methyltransferase